MANVIFEVQGINETIETLSQCGRSARKKLINLVSKTALDLQRTSRKGAPVDTGHLRRSILVSFQRHGLGATVIARAPYAGYVHEGTENKDGSVRMAARPFMRDPWEKKIEPELIEGLEKIKREVGEEFDR